MVYITNELMKTNSIFNPDGDDSIENRKIWGGNTTNLMELNNVQYGWAAQLYQQMRENFWIPQKYSLTEDVTDYRNLTSGERRAFNGVLSYLTFLDSIQTCNIPHLKATVTAPEVSLCLAEQTSQEAMHSESYQYMIESLIPDNERSAVYEFWREDKILYDRCKYIASLYQDYVDYPSEENYFIALLGDYMLEGLYFYNGFNLYYTLANRQLMSGSADIFKVINRDELSHVRLFQKLIKEAMQVFPHSQDQIYEMFDKAIQNEIEWTNHIVNNDVLGITEKSTEDYTKYLANQRLRAIGLNSLYPDFTKNPYKHLEKFSDTSLEGSTKANFFESAVTSYSQSSAVEGWDF